MLLSVSEELPVVVDTHDKLPDVDPTESVLKLDEVHCAREITTVSLPLMLYATQHKTHSIAPLTRWGRSSPAPFNLPAAKKKQEWGEGKGKKARQGCVLCAFCMVLRFACRRRLMQVMVDGRDPRHRCEPVRCRSTGVCRRVLKFTHGLPH